MHIRKIKAIFWKQVKDTLKNKAILIQFVMFPVLAIIMEASVQIEGLEENYFVMLFATMYIGMAPLTGMATVIAEEKEKHTLRMLIMSNVRAYEYLIGVGMYVLVACMIGSLSFGLTAGYTGSKLLLFVLVMATGILLSTLLGAVIGVGSKNQMAATSIVVPVMIFFSFLPMIAMFNKTIEAVSRFTYSQQVNYLLKDIQTLSVTNENIYVIGGNLLLILVLFRYAYMKSRFA